MFKEIPRQFLSEISTGSDRIPTLYYSKNWPVRYFFWMRLRLIFMLMKRSHHIQRARCLDFGGGGGVFLPSLSSCFNKVVCIDLEDEEAHKVVLHYQLKNVHLVREDIATANLEDAPFDAIVAADVLEHFQDLSFPVDALRKWIAPQGILYTSLPTENYLYVFLRKIFSIVKPWDHYHTSSQVEEYLSNHGFKKICSVCVPFYFTLFPLFQISAWRLENSESHK